MLKFTIKPYDVLYFGSGKPFNVGGDVESIFPPFPHSFASAIYAKFYAETGIEISENRGIYKAVYGPFLKKGEKLLFPAPLDIMKEKKKENGELVRAKMKRGEDFKLLNLCDTNLPQGFAGIPWVKSDKESCEYEPFIGYITLSGLKKWLFNDDITQEDLITADDIYEKEDRVSIHLEDEKKTVKEEDGLYRVRFIRLKDDISFVFYIEADFDEKSPLTNNNINTEIDLREIFEKTPKVLKIGGESRVAFYEVEIEDFKTLFDEENLRECEEYQLLFLTPAVFYDEDLSEYENVFSFLKGFEITNSVFNNYVLEGISSNYNKKYSNKTIRAISPGTLLSLKGYNPTSRLEFFKNTDYFIGSNLVLIKEL